MTREGPVRHRAEAKVVKVIRVTHLRSAGGEGDPLRNVVSYFTFDGRKLVENDPACPQRDDD